MVNRHGGKLWHWRWRQKGRKSGILDADIRTAHQSQRPAQKISVQLRRMYRYGTDYVLMAWQPINWLLVYDDNSMVWRGPMASKALMQMLQETLWPDPRLTGLDMPPGTGDIQLTLAQNIPVTCASEPRHRTTSRYLCEKRHCDVRESRGSGVGHRQNMSVHICSNCGHDLTDFRTGGAESNWPENTHTQLWQMPLHISLREDLDKGMPTVISRPESEFTAHLPPAWLTALQLSSYWQGEVIPGEDFLPRGSTPINHSGYSSYTAEMLHSCGVLVFAALMNTYLILRIFCGPSSETLQSRSIIQAMLHDHSFVAV
ncbi:P-loop NTPase [Shigella flexneri]